MQKLTINLPLFSIQIDGSNERDLFAEAAFWMSIPTKCGFAGCGKPVGLEYQTPKTFKYYKLKCTGTPAHALTLGQRQSDNGLYYDPKKPWEVFRAGNVEHADEHAAPAADAGTIGGDSARRNQLIRLISDCKNAGLRCGILAADVGKMETPIVEKEIHRLAAILSEGAKQ